MNTATIKNSLIEKIKHLSVDQLKLVENLVNQFDLTSNSVEMTLQESQAMEKWEYLVKHHQEMDDTNPLSNEDITLIRQFFKKQNKTIPLDLPKAEIFIADDFNDPLPDDIIDLFYQ
jgi:hypothetical protein